MTQTKVDIWMPISIGDYLKDTQHLDATRHGCYLLWMFHYWIRGPLPNCLEDLVAIGKLRGADAPSIAQALLVEFFLRGDDGFWHHKRIDRDLEAWKAKRLKAQAKAKKAANVKWRKDAPSNAPSNAWSTPQAMLNRCPSSSSSSSSEKTNSISQQATPSASPKARPTDPPKDSSTAFHFPPWLDMGAWDGFVVMRKRIRAPLTDRAVTGTLRDLEKLRAGGQDPNACLDQSTQRSWRGVFAIKPDYVQNGGSNGKNNRTKAERSIDALRGYAAELADRDGAYEDGSVPSGPDRRDDDQSLLGTVIEGAVGPGTRRN